MSKVPRIVLTGGPGGGKTTTLNDIRQTMPECYTVNEASTVVLSGGYPSLGANRKWSQAWQGGLQTGIRGVQTGLEQLAEYEAEQRGSLAIVQDRSHIDAAAYHPSLEDFEQTSGIRISEELGKIAIVFFLPTFAGTAKYHPETNENRFEDEEEMVQIDQKTKELNQHHPRLITIDSPSLSDRVQICKEILSTNFERMI
ncbi:AAA family ATPase [Candidatus Saccharibacteria bacterium]|nr:AAA family ATPase [Candidatus Saccharibacteria bacterium]MBP7834957.1 AAA family ATPase [Candidatus Saccharibacteria bacterium]